jgi:hypothetical protein
MPTITLDQVIAEQQRLAAMIEAFKAGNGETEILIVSEASIELRPGEHYAGLLLDDDGEPSHHLVLLPGQTKAPWDKARDWAASIGGELPTLREQSLLFANLKAEFEGDWYWSGQAYENDGSSAWFQNFYYGYQNYYRKSYEGRARAVRRFPA